MKKFLALIITFFSIFLIYRHFNNDMINYVSIGDGLIKGLNDSKIDSYGYNDFLKEYLIKKNRLMEFNNLFYNRSINGLIKDIKTNRTIRDNNKEYYFKKVLRESDLLVISIGMEELASNYEKYNMDNNYIYFNKMYLELEELINEVKKYAKGMVILIGLYNPTDYYDSKTDEFFCDIDIKLNRLMMEYDFNYIDLYELVKGNRYKDKVNSTYLNIRGYEKLAELIKFYID